MKRICAAFLALFCSITLFSCLEESKSQTVEELFRAEKAASEQSTAEDDPFYLPSARQAEKTQEETETKVQKTESDARPEDVQDKDVSEPADESADESSVLPEEAVEGPAPDTSAHSETPQAVPQDEKTEDKKQPEKPQNTDKTTASSKGTTEETAKTTASIAKEAPAADANEKSETPEPTKVSEPTKTPESSKTPEPSVPVEIPEPEPVQEAQPEPTLSPEAPATTEKPATSKPSEPTVTVPTASETGENLVWVPVNGGTKYHKRSSCSKMKDPIQVTVETATANGYTPCKRCYKNT